MASPTYTAINASEVDADSPLTASLAFRWTYNTISIMQGSPTARAAGMGVWIAKSPGGGDPAQTAILTDATDTSLRLAPDGAGSVVWTSAIHVNGNLKYINYPEEISLLFNDNLTANNQASSEYTRVFGGKNLEQTANTSRLIVSFVGIIFGQFAGSETQTPSVTFRLHRIRATTDTILYETTRYGHNLVSVAFTMFLKDCQNGDKYYIDCVFYHVAAPLGFAEGLLTIASIN